MTEYAQFANAVERALHGELSWVIVDDEIDAVLMRLGRVSPVENAQRIMATDDSPRAPF